jgi:hypothetical protein
MAKRQSSQDLVLNLKAEYFDQIASGEKHFEYRLQTPYWNRRLLRDPEKPNSPYRDFARVIIRKGYPKAGAPGREIVRPWRGAARQEIQHPHFGPKPVAVHAIIVNILKL